ncbi:MAG: helix-turn-helix transcriptional regulator [Saprospiraceae bacterium]
MQEVPGGDQIFLLSLEVCIVFLCAFSMVYLYLHKWENNKWLLLAFFGAGWFFLNQLLGPRGYGIVQPSLLYPNLASLLLVFPAFYLYVANLVRVEELHFRKWLPHFVPFLAFFVWFLLTDAQSAKKLTPLELPLPFAAMALVLALSSVLYNFWIYRLFRVNQLKYQDEYSDANVFITLDWLKWMIWVLGLMPILGVGSLFFGQFIHGFPALDFAVSTILIYCSMLSFFSFRQPVLYKMEALFDVKIEDEVQEGQQEGVVLPRQILKTKIILDEQEIKELVGKLEKYIAEEKPFLDPKIRMPELAAELNIPRHIFSFLINEHYGKNFFSFINEYRVEYAVELLQNEANQQYSLEAIGQMAGFNSKSTFNSRFKEIMGQTPGEFLLGKQTTPSPP